MNKIKSTFIALALIAATSVTAQNSEKNSSKRPSLSSEEMISRRADRLVVEMGLDDNTAVKFKDVYKRYAKDLQGLRTDNKDNKVRKDDKTNTLTDAQIDAQTKERFSMQRKQLDLQVRYYNEFRKVLSARQTNRVLQPSSPMQPTGFGSRGQMGRSFGQLPNRGQARNGISPMRPRQMAQNQRVRGRVSGQQFTFPNTPQKSR